MRLRLAVGAIGLVLAAYGAFLVLSRQGFGDWVEIAAWLAVGVVVHDGVLAPLAIGAGLLVSRVVPSVARGPVAVGAVVLATSTLLAIPVLGRFGARADNPTLLDRNYVIGWLVLAALVTVGVVVGTLLHSRASRPPGEVGVLALVLVVDDDHTVREVVVSYLRAHRHEVVEAADGEEALRRVKEREPDLVVLDLMLPGIDGLEVCRRLRLQGEVPIIMLTALGAETDRVAGLEIGADDYVTKPFSPRELALRVDSVLRRTDSVPASPPVLTDGDLVLDSTRHEALRDGAPLALTGREFDLLRFLVAHPGVAYSRDDLLQQVWGWSVGDSSTVTVHVRRLREKIEPDPKRPVRLVTVWGVGYRWEGAA